jgi:enamine deaminase RidA (YjgF/YER057c/UK114 family)
MAVNPPDMMASNMRSLGELARRRGGTRPGTRLGRFAIGLAGQSSRRAVFALCSAIGLGRLAATRAEARHQGDNVEPTITHLNPEAMHNNPAFTQAVIVEGNARTIYIGGQNAVDADGQIVGSDLAAQTEQVFNNVETILDAAGATLHDIIKWNVYVVQGQDLGAGFAVFQQRWGTTAKPPAITFAFVAGLANPEFLVEIEAIAVTGQDASVT